MAMEVVAEGIETAEQLRLLTALRCEYGQGFLFSKPVDAEEAGALITNRPQWHADAYAALEESPVAARNNVTRVKFG
jgi:sensor c-di-GMP phosphodiesterase-like protein